MTTPDSDIEIFPKTELQEDWYTHSPTRVDTSFRPWSPFVTANLDRNGKLTISFIKSGSVFNAHRNLDRGGNAVKAWTVDDTQFPSSTGIKPIFLDSILSPSNATFLAAIGLDMNSRTDTNLYILDSSSRFPHWELCDSKPTGIDLDNASIFITRNNTLKIAVSSNSSSMMHIYDPFKKTWVEETNKVYVYSYQVGSAFSQITDNDDSQWGYLGTFYDSASGKDVNYALAILNFDHSENGYRVIKNIHMGYYISLAYVSVGGDMPRTTPLIFGITNDPPRQRAIYFQAQGNGTYSLAYPFGTELEFSYLDAIFRTGLDVYGNNVEWIDIFALDTDGNLWHTRNAAYDTGRSTAVKRLSNGDIVVPEWETPSIITSKAITRFHLAKEGNGTGHAYVVTEVTTSNSESTLETYVQDMASTSWTKTTVASNVAPDIFKRNVYYIELTVRKGGVPAPDLTAKITSPEFCQIDANGVSTSVTSGQFYITHTNARGLICLTVSANESLACPAMSVWVEGMPIDKTIDIQPNGNIQKRLASITIDDLKKAEDQKDKTLIFGKLSDAELTNLAASLKGAASAFVDSSVTSSGSSSTLNATTQTYLHPKASQEVAITRHVLNPHLGLITHATRGKSFRICLKPNLMLPDRSTPSFNSKSAFLESITSSWGDFWTQVTNGVVEVGDVVLIPIENAVEAKVICLVDGAMKVWNGVASFVRQVFDVFGELFKAVNVVSQKIFNWLGYLFAWDDIKATAVGFRDVFDAQIGSAQGYMDKTARTQLKNFIGDAKSWLKSNMDIVLNNSENLTVGEYDKPESDPSNNLPSSASWLSNKVDNASKSTDFNSVITMTDGFNSTIQAFMNKLTATGISDDLSNALKKASDFFSNLTSRGVLDELTFKSLAQVIDSVVVLLLDLLEAVIDTLVDVLVQALKIFKDIVDNPIDIPLISMIFKDTIGLDLTLFNLIAVPMAVPSTILYKIFMGKAPFPQSNSDATDTMARFSQDSQAESFTKPPDPLMVWSAIFTAIYGTSDLIMDSAGDSPNPLMIIPKYSSVLVSWFILGLTALDMPTNNRTRYALQVAVLGTVTSTMTVCFDLAGRKMICLEPTVKGIDFMGTLIPFGYGVATIFSGLWHIANIYYGTETGSKKDWAVVFAEVTGGVPGAAKIIEFSRNPQLKPILMAIDAFAYGATTVAFISAASASTST